MHKFVNGGEFIKKVREDKELTQLEFSREVGVHPQMVSNWERGESAPPKKYLEKIFKDTPARVKQAYVVLAIADAKAVVEKEFSEAGFWPREKR